MTKGGGDVRVGSFEGRVLCLSVTGEEPLICEEKEVGEDRARLVCRPSTILLIQTKNTE